MQNMSGLYNPRKPEQSPFYKLVSEYFDEFVRIYPEKYEKSHGYFRPVISSSIERFLKCGDLKQGFARIKCTKCGTESILSFSCKQRCSCPSCHQKRTLLLAIHLKDDVLLEVPHKQFVFTIPKRLRIYFRYNRKLLGKLAKVAWETVKTVYLDEIDYPDALPAAIIGIQSFGNLVNWHPHIHALFSTGVFLKSGKFITIPDIPINNFLKVWEDNVFSLLLKEECINQEIVDCMNKWKYSGFSIDNSVYIAPDDRQGLQNIIEYIARCPFSVTRMIKITEQGKVLYRAGNVRPIPFPVLGDDQFKTGISRNFQLFEPNDFLAEITQHIPNKGEHLIRYYGYYSNKNRGMRNKAVNAGILPKQCSTTKKCSISWALLIKLIYEVDPLKCKKCGAEMKIIAFIQKFQKNVIKKILSHLDLWNDIMPRSPPIINYVDEVNEGEYDYNFFDTLCS